MSDRPTEYRYNPDRFPHFEAPTPNQAFDRVMYEVLGHTRAQNHLITIAQHEFLVCWLADDRMTALLQAWSASVGLPEIITDVAAFLDRVAHQYGLSRRGDLGRTARPPHLSVEDDLPEWYGLQDRLYAAYRRLPEVRNTARTYVCDDLQQPWLWLAYRLTYYVFDHAWQEALGINMIYQRTSHIDAMWDLRAQPFRFVFETRHGETVPEAKQRLMAEATAACANIQPTEADRQDLPKGVIRPDRERTTRRNTQWLYCYLIGQVHGPNISIYHLAKEFHPEQAKRPKKHGRFPTCSCQVDIRTGMTSAQKLLDLTPGTRELLGNS